MRRLIPLVLVLPVALSACGRDAGRPAASGASTSTVVVTPSATPTPPTPSAPSAPASATTSAATDSAAPATPSTTAPATTTPAPPATSAPASASASACSATANRLTPAQRAGQLLMVGVDPSAPRATDSVISDHHVGNVLYLGGWRDASSIGATSGHLQSLATPESTGGIGMIVAADQEGGQVQQLRGPGFTRLPSALQQGTQSADAIRSTAEQTGRELKAAGVNVNLAPVADTVAPGVGRGNDPIGRWGRHYATDPVKGAAAVGAATTGFRAGGVGAVVKHFPGLGRIRSNTDFSADGITDETTTVDDAYLAPFAAGAAAGAAVMVSSAIYPKIDADHNAVFSRAVVTDLLRGRMGFGGLVMSDDLGVAKAVSGVPAGQRAVKAIGAGVDLIITGRPADAAPMTAALAAKAESDPAFAQRLTDAVTHVLDYKAGLGITRCG